MKHINRYIQTVVIILFISLVIQLLIPNSLVLANRDGQFSTIGGIEVTVKKESEIQRELAESIAEWRTQPIIVKGQAGKIEIPADMIRFDVKETVTTYLEAIKIPWYKPWMKTPIVHIPLFVEASEEMDQKLRGNPLFIVEDTKEAILTHASLLRNVEVIPEEITIHKDILERTAFEIQEIHGNRANLLAFVEQLDQLVLGPAEAFSFLDKMDGEAGLNDFETRQFFASVLYSVVLQSETKIIERHSQNKVPTYLQPGIEVDVSARLKQDFVFQNNSDSPMLFGARIEGTHLLIELYTLNSSGKATYSIVETEIKPRTIYRLSSTVKSGQEKVIQNGSNGYRVNVYKTYYDEVLGYEVDEEISRDFYPPVHKVIAVASEEEVKQGESADPNGESNGETTVEVTPPGNPTDSNPDNQNTVDDPQENEEEIIYDKGGNVIYDPNE